MILPDLSSGEDHHRSLGEVLLPAFPGSSGEEVAGVDHRRGDARRDPASACRRIGASGLHPEDFGGMVAHAFHGVAAALQSLAEDLRVLDLLRVDLAWVAAAGGVRELLCRSDEHTSELPSLMTTPYAVYGLK